MDRLFEYDEAKDLCSRHGQIIHTIQTIKDSRAKDTEKIVKASEAVFNSRETSNKISIALETDNIDFPLSQIEMELFYWAYVKHEGEDIITKLDELQENYSSISQNLKNLNNTNSGFKWFLANKRNKENANKAYNRLTQILESNYPESVKELADRNKNIETLSIRAGSEIVSGNEQEYIPYVRNYTPTLFSRENKPIRMIDKIEQGNDTIAQYKTAIRKQNELTKLSENTITQAINTLIMESTLREMRQQDVETIAVKRSGIRIKSLKDHGYRNIADVYAATQYQLASVNGISTETAITIKETTNEIAQDIAKTIKISISDDDRTPAATSLLNTVYTYLEIKNAGKHITPEIIFRIEDAEKQITHLFHLHNNLIWLFLSSEQKHNFSKAYRSLENDLNEETVNAINAFNQDIHENKTITDIEIWTDFAERSIEYYNLLEEICPGAFGNNDLLYGLPEDLAREIQDQVYFPQGLKVTLRRYQEWGVKYILHQGRVLLGDEMGLGKTVQAIATMVSLRNTGAKKFLIVCPASVLPNWCKEIDKKSEFHSIRIHGYDRQEAFDSWNEKGGAAVTTYETLNALQIPQGLEYDLLIVDEAHYVKNENAQRSQNIRKLGTYTNRLLYMTGTALENKVEEMLSLLQILNPQITTQAQKIAFMSTAPQFRQIIAPIYYRRKREDVLTELPAITNSNEWCDLMSEERAAYRKAVLAKDQTAIRKVSWLTKDLRYSAKARRMKEIIEEAESDGRKVLIFSFYLETIERVQEMLGKRCTQSINGSVPIYRRQEIIDEFEKMPAGSVLPAQIQAGGTGLNIQSASVVIICEPQLKPSIENQAISRAYRMGQTRKVLVYRLLASDTIDERIENMLTEKQAVFDAFADISEAAKATKQEEQKIDDKTFGKLIQEEIDRINAENGNLIQQEDLQIPVEKTNNSEKTSITSNNRSSEGKKRHVTSGKLSNTEKAETNTNATKKTIGQFERLEDFIAYANECGITIKDNREKGGCIWIKSDPQIDEVLKLQVFGDRTFRFSTKSKALNGESGWYY